MLSRTADNLFWAARYLERAEGLARLIEMGQRMTMIPGAGRQEWRSVAAAAGAAHLFSKEERVNEAAIVNQLLLTDTHPMSIRFCLNRARECARSVRTSFTQEMWEALNDGWRRLEMVDERSALRELPTLLEWVKTRASMFRGATQTTMLRNDRYYFLRLGSLIERVDLTLRLLDVKYYVLLPESDVVGGGRDHHQWTSILHAISAAKSYHHLYRGDYSPWFIADFLILNQQFPRSVSYSYGEISWYLNRLAQVYDQRHRCNMLADKMVGQLADMEMHEMFQTGLHAFTTDAIQHNNLLSREISRAYNF